MSPFMLSMALNMLGLTEQQKEIVMAAIPEEQAVVDLITKNMTTVTAAVNLFNSVYPHIQRAAPAMQILADAIARRDA